MDNINVKVQQFNLLCKESNQLADVLLQHPEVNLPAKAAEHLRAYKEKRDEMMGEPATKSAA